MLCNLAFLRVAQYVAFPAPLGMDTLWIRSVKGCVILAYPLIRLWKYSARPRKLDRFKRSGGWHQLTIAVSFSVSGWTPLVPTLDPANTISVMKSSNFFTERDIDFFLTRSKKRRVQCIMSLKSFLAIPESSSINSMSILGSRLLRFSDMTRWNMAGDPIVFLGL